jgi:hypothetical protein
MTRPDARRLCPGQETESQKIATTTSLKTIQPTGCPCGHLVDEECARHRPVPVLKGCGGCESLSADQIAYCSRRGFYCGPNSCALALMIGGAA